MKSLLEKEKTLSGEIIIIDLTILFYLFRTSIPFFKYPFLLLYIGLIIYTCVKHHNGIIFNFKEYLKNFLLIILLLGILILSFLLSNKLFLTIFKDILNAIVLLSFFYILSFYIIVKKNLNLFISTLFIQIVFFALLISFNEIFDVFNILQGFDNFNLFTSDANFTIDYNFAILPVFLGMLVLFFFLLYTKSLFNIIIYNVILIVYSFSIFLSGSRRGFFLLLVIIGFITLTQLLQFFRRAGKLKQIASKSIFFLIFLTFLIVTSCCAMFFTSYSFKNGILKMMGSKNILDTKEALTTIMFRYTTIFNKSVSYTTLYKNIWTPVFNPNDPESSWGTRIHKNIYPLTGKHVAIVPEGANGYLMDSTCNPSLESTYCDSYSLIAELDVKKGDRYKASVFCFVSDNFDGDSVMLAVPFVCINNNIVYGITRNYYDINKKNIWKKLEIDFTCNTGKVPIYISFLKKGVTDFRKLEGYVIFAYPSYERIKNADSILSGSFNASDILIRTTEYYHCKNKSRLMRDSITGDNTSFYSYSQDDIVLLEKKLTTLNMFNIADYISNSLPLISFLKTSYQDPIRSWASKVISEDTTYYPYKSNIVLDTISNSFIGDRVSRWQFAFEIFSKEYNWKQKIFGGGFNFLNWYGSYFFNNKTKSDWPHNPFLSILLYSGIIGLVLYLILMYKVFYYYIKYFNEYKILFIFFIITFFFSFFSAGSPFDPPIMGFFVILPFFIHSVHEREKELQKSKPLEGKKKEWWRNGGME